MRERGGGRGQTSSAREQDQVRERGGEGRGQTSSAREQDQVRERGGGGGGRHPVLGSRTR